ncbi:MAG: TusE/DsrC/DsvC family sulfur relay protein [Nitrospirae bacterium]|nr:TusE/DsrC/DsvC family sulfur relay protein [Nitrospirota bacterium]
MNNMNKAMINLMARKTGTTLTGEHMRVLTYAHKHYEKHRVGPLYQNIRKNTGLTKEDIERLFPHGLNSIYNWVGIPIQSTDNGCKPIASVNVKDRMDVYLDHNATTYLRKEVTEALISFCHQSSCNFSGNFGSNSVGNLGKDFGNPQSSTSLGKRAYDTLQKARYQISQCIDALDDEIVFTGSGSEANNLAIKGVAFKHMASKGHIITSATEHSSVLKTVGYLEGLGFEATYLGVDGDGVVRAQDVRNTLRPDTLLVAVMAANNEIGTVNPIGEIGAICREKGVPLMVDAVQAFGKMPLSPGKMGISLMSMSGHKIYAPKGVGALYVEKGFELVPLIHGGDQEGGLRAGTENVASIMAFGLAATLAHEEMDRERERLVALRNYFLAGLKDADSGFIVNGSLEKRLPNNLSIGFPGIDSGSLLLSLNQIGVYVSSGSACSSGRVEASHVIRALGIDTEKYGVIRFSFGMNTTTEALDYLFRYLPDILRQLDRGQRNSKEKFGNPR